MISDNDIYLRLIWHFGYGRISFEGMDRAIRLWNKNRERDNG